MTFFIDKVVPLSDFSATFSPYLVILSIEFIFFYYLLCKLNIYFLTNVGICDVRRFLFFFHILLCRNILCLIDVVNLIQLSCLNNISANNETQVFEFIFSRLRQKSCVIFHTRYFLVFISVYKFSLTISNNKISVNVYSSIDRLLELGLSIPFMQDVR